MATRGKADDNVMRLVEAISSVGGENHAQLARLVGMPEETVRYKMHRQFPKQHIAIHLSINYERIALSRKVISVTFASQHASKARRALDELSQELYITYFAKTIGSRTTTMMTAVPTGSWPEYKDFLEYTKEKGIVESYKAEDAIWSRHFPIKADLYDFQRGEWNFEWSELDRMESGLTGIPVTDPDVSIEEPDKTDLLILAELQADANISVSRIADKIKVSEDVAYYHYTEHAKKRGMIAQHMVGWVGTGGPYDRNSVSKVIFAYEDVKEDELGKVRDVFHRFPFSWMELYTGDNTYYVFANIPSNQLNAALHFVDQNVHAEKLQIRMCDSYESAGFGIPAEMFEDKKGWLLNKAKMIRDFQGYFR